MVLVTPIFSTVLALGAVVALVFISARVARRYGFGVPLRTQNSRRLQLQDSMVLDRARSLHLVRCDGRDLLIMTGSQSEAVVGWMPAGGAPGGEVVS